MMLKSFPLTLLAVFLLLIHSLCSCSDGNSISSMKLIGKAFQAGQMERKESHVTAWGDRYYTYIKQPDRYFLVYLVTNPYGNVYEKKTEVSKEIHDSTIIREHN